MCTYITKRVHLHNSTIKLFSTEYIIFIDILLAHLSRRLIGELIVYPWSGVRRPSVRPSVVVVIRSQCSNILISETTWPIKAKFYVEPPWVGGTIFCSRHLGHMTKMAATPVYGKNPFTSVCMYWPKVVCKQKIKPDFLRNCCAGPNHILYASYQVQGNENLMT